MMSLFVKRKNTDKKCSKMKRIILNTMKFLLRKITVISFVSLSLLFCYSFVSQSLSASPLSKMDKFPQDPIVGKWKLVSTSSGRDIAQGNITQPNSVLTVELILEFKPDMLTVQCLRKDNNCSPWYDGDYLYWIDRYNEATIRINHTDWRYHISENKLMIGRAHIGGINYYFKRM